MTVQEHLEDRLKNPLDYPLSNEDKKIIQFEGIETYIYRKLTSGKFRRSSMDEDSVTRVKEAIHINVANDQPIKFTYPFGGYKSWRLPSYPEVDWAEFMTISYVLRYVASVAAAYAAGVEIYFSSDDVCIELIDNYPREALDSYVKSFHELLSYFRKYLSNNVKIDLKQCVPDYYTQEDYDKELDEHYQALKQEGLTDERKDKLKNVNFAFNFLRNGKEDFSDESKYEAVLEDLMLYSEAYLKLRKRREFVRGDDKIVLFSSKISKAIDIGSTNVSKAKFWVGFGTLEHDERYHDRIMSPKQWESVKGKAKYEDVAIIDMKNFENIPAFDQRFDFILL